MSDDEKSIPKKENGENQNPKQIQTLNEHLEHLHIIGAELKNWYQRKDFFAKANPAQVVQAFCSMVAALAACWAIYSVVHSLQGENPRDARECIAQLYPMDVQLNTDLAHYPKAWKAFDNDPNGETYKNLDEANYAVFITACESAGDEFEYYFLIRGRIQTYPNASEIIRSWNAYFSTTCTNSYGFRSRIMSETNIWTSMFMTEFYTNSIGLDYMIENSTNAIIKAPQ